MEHPIEMARMRKVCLIVTFIDMEEAYDSGQELFEVLGDYAGVHNTFVSLI